MIIKGYTTDTTDAPFSEITGMSKASEIESIKIMGQRSKTPLLEDSFDTDTSANYEISSSDGGGERVVETTPGGHWHTTTMLAAIRPDGVIGEAYMAFPGATDGAMFLMYIQEMLAPTLSCSNIVVMDNLPAQKVKGVREAIEARGAELWYQPPYSPDLNPIEMMWSKVKALIRKAKARTVEPLYDAIGEALCADTGRGTGELLQGLRICYGVIKDAQIRHKRLPT